MKRVLITGAHGFIGRHVARRFATAGWTVAGIGHGHWPPNEREAHGVSFWHPTDLSIDSLKAHAGSPDVIVHCAGSGSVAFSMSHPLEDYARTVGTTAAVLEYIRLYSPTSRLIYPSSAAVYGDVRHLPISESEIPAPVSPYGVHKVIAEMLCNMFARNFSVDSRIVRLFSIYGQGLRKQLLWDGCAKLARGDNTFFGTGAELRDWLHVEDASELIYLLAVSESLEATTVNGGSGTGVTVEEVLRLVCASTKTLTRPHFTGVTRPGDPPGYCADVTRANRLGWKPTHSLSQGIEEYVDWFRAQQK